MQITLTPEQEKFLQTQLNLGKYSNSQDITEAEIAAEIEAYRRRE